jgi:uncharacterized membrane protein
MYSHQTAPSPHGLERIVFFSDAVMAIAITLLVLDLRLPEATGTPAAEIGRRMLALWPKALGYLVSFWVIALYWVAHLRCFRYMTRYNRRLIYLNFLFLMFIAFMPFPTSLLFEAAISTVPVALYAGTAAGMGLSLAGLWEYGVRTRLVGPAVDAPMIRSIRLNLLLPPLVFIFSMIVALFNPMLAIYSWLLLLPVYLIRRFTEPAALEDSLR